MFLFKVKYIEFCEGVGGTDSVILRMCNNRRENYIQVLALMFFLIVSLKCIRDVP